MIPPKFFFHFPNALSLTIMFCFESIGLYLPFIPLKYPPQETPVFSHTLIPIRFDCLLLSPFPISQNFSTGPFKVSLCSRILHLFCGQFIYLLLLILTWLFRGSCFPCGYLKGGSFLPLALPPSRLEVGKVS